MRTIVATKASPIRHSLASELSFIRTEQHRIEVERKINADLEQHVEDDLASRRERARATPLDRTAYEALFDPAGLYL